MLTTDRVEREHRPAVRPLAEAIESGGRIGVCERVREIELRERRVGSVEMRTEHASPVAAAKIVRPERVRLVLENLAARERERLLERPPSRPCRLTRRPLEQLVETVEIELDQICREPVRLRFRDHELPRPLAVGDEAPS